jgi:pimeloyl-ACP methyl ester carboxylesterase
MSGRMIDLAVVVIPARGGPRSPDPIFFLPGGPGGAATLEFSGAASILLSAGAHRDIVLVDQRGTGGSNELACPISADDTAGLAEEIGGCLADLPGDPRAYTTAWAIDDLDEVRAALGYHTINLFGWSYGGTAIQVYLQRHPMRARTATLLATTLLDVPMFERVPSSSQRAFDLLVARCAGDPRCHAAYPDLPGDLAAVAARLSRGPVELPRSVDGEPLLATREALGPWVHSQLMGAARTARLPRLLHAASQGDWDEVSLAALRQAAPAERAWQVMDLTIMCHEPWARQRRAETEAWAAGSYLSYQEAVTVPEEICARVPRPPAAALYDPPVEVPVPALFVQADADPQNPPENVAGAGRHYPDSRVLVAPGQSHQEWSRGYDACLGAITAGFIDSGAVDAAPAECLSSVAAPPIVLP